MMPMDSVQYIKANSIGHELVTVLSLLPFSNMGTRRLCLHETPQASFHVMLIECKQGQDYPAHAHTDGPELISIIEGELLVEFIDHGAKILSAEYLLKASDSSCKAVFIPQNMVHTTKARSVTAIYLEVKLGPYCREALKRFP